MSQDDLFGDAAPAPALLERLASPAPGQRCALFFALHPDPDDALRLAAQADARLQGASAAGWLPSACTLLARRGRA
ncbi:MAG: hypothetical protein EOO29_27270 [Comamonadaceae bacterium]|nr:MAG: hypothetical protein EOO29_27270 [Comamonadaceae bacterium]